MSSHAGRSSSSSRRDGECRPNTRAKCLEMALLGFRGFSVWGNSRSNAGPRIWGSPGLPDSPDSTVEMRGKHPRPWASYSRGKNPRRGRCFGLVPVGGNPITPSSQYAEFRPSQKGVFPRSPTLFRSRDSSWACICADGESNQI